MVKNRMLSWILVIFMLAGIFTGVRMVFPQTAQAEEIVAKEASTAGQLVAADFTASTDSGNIELAWNDDPIAPDSPVSVTSSAANFVLPLAKPVLSKPVLENGVVELNWSPVPEALFYDVNVLDDAGNILAGKCITNIAAPVVTAVISGLTDGAVYRFSITAKRNEDTMTSDISEPLTYTSYIPPTVPVWQQSIFGSSTNTADNAITINSDNSITIASLNNKGKISSSADGIAYYYTELDTGTPFQITVDASVESFLAGNDQVAFGLMLRQTVGTNGDTSGHKSNFIAVGACTQKIQVFSRRNDASSLTKTDLIPVLPKAGDKYTLRINRTADGRCIVSCGSQAIVIDGTDDLAANGKFYIGMFAARNAEVTFSNVDLVTKARDIAITSQPSKTEYFQGESLDTAGMVVTATFEDGGSKVLGEKEYTITGFDSNTAGVQKVTVNYAGRTAEFEVNVKALVCTGIEIVYTPAKTTYYLEDPIDTLGMVINASYSNGTVKILDPSEYTISGFDSSSPGQKTVTVRYNAAPAVSAGFVITVRESLLQGLEITRLPLKTVYYPGDTLNLNGLVVSAIYDDSRVILQSGEYAVDSSGFDTASEGQKIITISHKGKTVDLPLAVKLRQFTGISVTTLPKTTFYAGEAFESNGIVVSRAYDNGDKEILNADEYTIDASAFNSNSPGVCQIGIIPIDRTIAAISYPVTIRAQTTYAWNTAIFGQSVSLANNSVTPAEPGAVNGTVTVTALTGGGKVTGAHDGISYYYTVIDAAQDNFKLSADIKVLAFAKETPDNQEAFGLMVRDAIGTFATSGTQPVFSSNVAAVGGYRGLTNAFMRTGVTNSAGNEGTVMAATSWNTARPGPSNTYPNATYRLTLEKTNTGFIASLNGDPATTALFYAPETFNTQDPYLYVGFYAARLATIEVSNVSFSVSAAATDAPGILPPPAAVTPVLNVISLANVSKTDYDLEFTSNVNGIATIKQGETVIASDVAVSAAQVFTRKTTIASNSNTNFTITMTPEASQALTSYDKLVTNFTVTMKTYETPDGAIYVSPAGTASAPGTVEDPLDMDTAIMYVKEGQTIYMRGGTYNRSGTIIVPIGNDGAASAMKTLAAYNGEDVTLDFGTTSAGFQLGGNYWHIEGINVTKASGTGLLVGGSNNIIERCSVYANGNTGLQISRFLPTLSREFWPANNLILNCEAYDNRDASENNADGFAAKLTCGEGNIFRGCIAHNNIDDGWDLYTKAETGPIGAVLIEDCIAYDNGTLTDGHIGTGDKNGFKLGGEGISVVNVIRNSLAFGNGAAGFTSNSNPAAQAYDCISFDNTGANFVFTTFNQLTPQFVLSGLVSYRSTPGAIDGFPASSASAANYFYNGTESVNVNGVALKDANFMSLTPVLPYRRDENGNIIRQDFLKFISPGDAALKSLMTNRGNVSPDFAPSTMRYVIYVKNNVKDITITPTASSPLYGSLKINSVAVGSGKPFKANLSKGDNYFTIVVTAQDGTTKAVYVLNVYKQHDNRPVEAGK